MSNNPLPLLLTGGTGFLGSSLLKALVGCGRRLTIIRRRTSRMDRVASFINHPLVDWVNLEETNLDELFKRKRFETIIHCATNYGRGNTNVLNIVSANLLLPLQLLQLGLQHGVKTFINTDTVIDKRVSDYSLSKKQFLDWLQKSGERMQCVNLAMEHFYGPFDDESKFTTMIFHKLMRNEPRIGLTAGEQRRHFIYVNDVVKAFICVIENLERIGPGFHSFDVSSRSNISIREFVTMAKRISGNEVTTLDFGSIPYRQHELMDSQTDISGLLALGWEPATPLADGIRMTIETEKLNDISH